MKKSFAHIMILILLSTQSAWAMYGASIDSDGPQSFFQSSYSGLSSSAGYDSDHNNSDQNTHDALTDSCDHFCHGGVHLLGLFNSNNDALAMLPSNFDTIFIKLNHSLIYQPPIPPPIV